MRTKWDRKRTMWKESKLDLFVLKSDHSRRNCDTATRHGADVLRGPRIQLHSGETIEEENKVSSGALALGWCVCLQSAGFK